MDTRLSLPEMERAFYAGDRGFDGAFVVAVRTTGIFCRPSCPARKPLPKNVDYFPVLKDAVFAGYRPCKRCRPLEASGTPPDWVAQLLKAVDAEPDHRWMAEDLLPGIRGSKDVPGTGADPGPALQAAPGTPGERAAAFAAG